MNPIDTVFDVRGMNCGSCARRITRALDAIAGVASVGVSLPEATVRVEYDPALLDSARLAVALAAAGYPAAPRAT